MSIQFRVTRTAQPAVQLYRKPHDVEIYSYNEPEDWRYGGDGYRSGPVRSTVIDDNANMPEVYRVYPEHPILLECRWVRLIRDMNPKIGSSQISTLLNWNYAFSNRTGFPYRYNCLTGEDIDKKDPALDTPRVCGGALLKGEERDGRLYFESLRTSGFVPSVAWMEERPWLWFWVTGVTKTGGVNLATKLGLDGQRYPVRMPLLSELQLWLPLSWLHKLEPGFVPADARWMPG